MSVPMCVCVDKIVNMCSCTYIYMYVCVCGYACECAKCMGGVMLT